MKIYSYILPLLFNGLLMIQNEQHLRKYIEHSISEIESIFNREGIYHEEVVIVHDDDISHLDGKISRFSNIQEIKIVSEPGMVRNILLETNYSAVLFLHFKNADDHFFKENIKLGERVNFVSYTKSDIHNMGGNVPNYVIEGDSIVFNQGQLCMSSFTSKRW